MYPTCLLVSVYREIQNTLYNIQCVLAVLHGNTVSCNLDTDRWGIHNYFVITRRVIVVYLCVCVCLCVYSC